MKLLTFYSTEIHKEFAGSMVTTSLIQLMNQKLDNIVSYHRSIEPLNDYWFIDVRLVYDIERNQLDIELVTPEQLEFVD